jgi:hypothetical protein
MHFPWGCQRRAGHPQATHPQEREAIALEILVYGCHWNALQLSNAYQREQSLTEQSPQGILAYAQLARYLAASQ